MVEIHKKETRIITQSVLKAVLLLGFFVFLFALPYVLPAGAAPAQGAVLFLSPSAGSFVVGGTFDVSLFINTQGNSINAADVYLNFPPDKLQLVSTSGKSIVSLWVATPTFDNKQGKINLQGVIPNGITTDQGLIITFTFRTKGMGTALVSFSDESRVLANDGKGTDILSQTTNGLYDIILPPPQGPIVVSETHPNQQEWYKNPNLVLRWSDNEDIDGYSYMLNDVPADIPDNISEGEKTGVSYQDLKSGTYYFHIKAKRAGSWGGVTHFAVRVDVDEPSEFPIKIEPGALTTNKNPILNWSTTDQHSGISHYTYAVIPLKPAEYEDGLLFVETSPPQILQLGLGEYDIIVRAFDKAGNVREVSKRLRIVTPFMLLLQSFWFWSVLIITLATLLFLTFWVRRWYKRTNQRRERKELPPAIRDQLEELKKFRNKYGKLTGILLIFSISSILFLGFVQTASAQQPTAALSPPIITAVSRNISNNEIFYIGGKTEIPRIDVVIYLQSVMTGAVETYTVASDKKGDWFYRHDKFLQSGDYLLWVQTKLADETSPPSPQVQMKVLTTALQYGASRLSYETLYLILAVLLLLATVGLSIFTGWHFVIGHKKRRLWMKEVKEAEESVRRGFAVLRRDIQVELETVRKAILDKRITEEELAEIKERQSHLLRNLASIEKYIGKEVWDIEEVGHEE